MSDFSKNKSAGFWAPATHKEPLKLYRKFFQERKMGNYAIAGSLVLFIGGVYYYTISSVTQEDFTTGVDERGYSTGTK